MQQVGIVDQGRHRRETLADLAGEGAHQGAGALQIGIFRGQMIEPGEHPDEGAIARWRRIVMRRFVARDQLLAAIRAVKIAARFSVPILRVEDFQPSPRALEEDRLGAHFVEHQRGARHLGVIVEEFDLLNLAMASGMAQARAIGHLLGDIVPGAPCRGQPVGPLKDGGGKGERGDHHAVPIGQHFVVPTRPNPFVAHCQQRVAQRLQFSLIERVAVGPIAQTVENSIALEIARRGHVINGFEGF